MPIPENPQSRSEQYLNAIATGDNSGLPAFPQSRMEQYLEVIAQNGGGSSGGGVLIVHATMSGNIMTLDKTWQEIYDAGGGVINTKLDATTMMNSYIYGADKYPHTYRISACAMQDSGGSMEFMQLVFSADSADGYPSLTMS